MADKAAAKAAVKSEKARLKGEKKAAGLAEKERKRSIKLDLKAAKAASKAAKKAGLPDPSTEVDFAEFPESYQVEATAHGVPVNATIAEAEFDENGAKVVKPFHDEALSSAAGKVAQMQQVMSFDEFNDMADVVEEDADPEWMQALADGEGDLIDEDALMAMFGDDAVKKTKKKKAPKAQLSSAIAAALAMSEAAEIAKGTQIEVDREPIKLSLSSGIANLRAGLEPQIENELVLERGRKMKMSAGMATRWTPGAQNDVGKLQTKAPVVLPGGASDAMRARKAAMEAAAREATEEKMKAVDAREAEAERAADRARKAAQRELVKAQQAEEALLRKRIAQEELEAAQADSDEEEGAADARKAQADADHVALAEAAAARQAMQLKLAEAEVQAEEAKQQRAEAPKRKQLSAGVMRAVQMAAEKQSQAAATQISALEAPIETGTNLKERRASVEGPSTEEGGEGEEAEGKGGPRKKSMSQGLSLMMNDMKMADFGAQYNSKMSMNLRPTPKYNPQHNQEGLLNGRNRSVTEMQRAMRRLQAEKLRQLKAMQAARKRAGITQGAYKVGQQGGRVQSDRLKQLRESAAAQALMVGSNYITQKGQGLGQDQQAQIARRLAEGHKAAELARQHEREKIGDAATGTKHTPTPTEKKLYVNKKALEAVEHHRKIREQQYQNYIAKKLARAKAENQMKESEGNAALVTALRIAKAKKDAAAVTRKQAEMLEARKAHEELLQKKAEKKAANEARIKAANAHQLAMNTAQGL